MTASDADDLALIVAAARDAGVLALEMRAKGLKTEFKPGNSPVTDADLAVDLLLKERLSAARPDYGWLSEETADDPARLERRRLFVVDPIDGTRAFIGDRPWWVVSIAVVDGLRPIAGAIFAPQLDEAYAAATGQGATLNGAAIRVSDASALEDCGMVGDKAMFGHPSWPRPWPEMRIHSRNSTAYRMCLVASGAFDAAVTMAPKHDWDLAAADLIAEEAGAFVGDHLGRPFAYNGVIPRQASLVCATPELTPLILDRLGHIAVRA